MTGAFGITDDTGFQDLIGMEGVSGALGESGVHGLNDMTDFAGLEDAMENPF